MWYGDWVTVGQFLVVVWSDFTFENKKTDQKNRNYLPIGEKKPHFFQ